jgi:hypothetical protein
MMRREKMVVVRSKEGDIADVFDKASAKKERRKPGGNIPTKPKKVIGVFNETDIKSFYKILNNKEVEIRAFNETSKKQFFVNSEDEAIKICKELDKTHNIYFGVNERTPNGSTNKDVIAVTTIPIDIDCVDKPANHEDLDKAKLVCEEIINDFIEFGYQKPPYAMSGNGYQIYLQIPAIEINDKNREEIESKLKQFGKSLIEKYSTEEVRLDNVFDLARIMRVPGTFNIKSKTYSTFINEKYLDDVKLKDDILNLDVKKPKTNIPITPHEGDHPFLDYCLTNRLPIGEIHYVITKNMAIYLFNHPDRTSLAAKYSQVQEAPKNELNNWFKKIENEGFNKFQINDVELANYTKKYKIPFDWDKTNPNEINWINTSYHNTWKKCKIKALSIFKNSNKEDYEPTFIAHDKDEIVGKPQLIGENYHDIKLIRKYSRYNTKKDETTYFIGFVDDKIQVTSLTREVDSLIEEFLIYKVVDGGREYFVLSKDRLGAEDYRFKGMKIKMDDVAEISKTFKINTSSTIFLLKDYENSIKSMKGEELVNFTKSWKKEFNLDYENFMDYFFYNPDTKLVYRHTKEYEMMRMAQLFGGKYEGYPLHNILMGPAGSGKTMELEAINSLYQEEICEAGTSTPKILIPSFKTVPAKQGFVISCKRIALIDELGKMIETVNTQNRDSGSSRQVLAPLNSILEHKRRRAGSGNDNDFMMTATAKVIICTNPVRNFSNLYQHLHVIDKTTLSRFFIWIQDKKELLFRKTNIPQTLPGDGAEQVLFLKNITNKNKKIVTPTLYHPVKPWASLAVSLQNLDVLDFDFEKTPFTFPENKDFSFQTLNDKVIAKLPKELKYLWQTRGLHHSILLLDGLVKFRCLFKDYDTTFTPKQEDIDWLIKILDRMVEGWTYNFGSVSEENLFNIGEEDI